MFKAGVYMVTGIIMAAGFSARMGKNKLMIEIEGKRIIERVIYACIHSKLDDIILVYRDDEIKSIGEEHKIKTVCNHNAHLGQSESVIAGIKNAGCNSSYMFLVGDQPFLSREIIDDLIDEFRLHSENIIIPFFNNRIGMPIIFPNRFRDDLLMINGDKGGREIINKNQNSLRKLYYENELLGMDVDTLEDLRRIYER